MFGPPGRAYVYLVYGMYHCLNIVTEPDGTPAALLVRAVEPVAGIEEMRRARQSRRPLREPIADARLASGPGLVCDAFSITRADDGTDLLNPASDLRLEEAAEADRSGLSIVTGPRVGISYAPEPWLSIPWRFRLAGNASVSRSAR